jgi:Zn finger protein HypA/HybF involved in hydrogenase expression
VRRIDGLWDKLIKMGIRPERLMLEWCSAAEGARWQTIMQEVEKKRQTVTSEELEFARTELSKVRVPRPRNPKTADENSAAQFHCLRCGNKWDGQFYVAWERICPNCRSNSVHWLRQTKQNHNSIL